MARKHGITNEYVVELYESGMPSVEIAEITGLTTGGVRYVAQREGATMRKVGQQRKHKVNEDFFKVWSHEMAWVLGMFITDGHINKSNHSIALTQKDEEVLRKVAREMDADYILSKISKTRPTPTLLVNSKIVKDDLKSLGVGTDKTLNSFIPAMDEKFLPHFIRGVIDGDGWVQNRGYVMNITTASSIFSKDLKTVFDKWTLNTRVTSEVSKSGTKIYRVWVSGKYDVAKLADIIYNDSSDLFVDIKKERMSQRLEEYLDVEDN